MEGMDHRARGRRRAGPLANAIVESEITIRQRHSRIRRLFTVANGVHTILISYYPTRTTLAHKPVIFVFAVHSTTKVKANQ